MAGRIRQQYQERDRHREDLKAAIQIGLDQADWGELLDGPEVFERVRARLQDGAGPTA